MSLKLDPSVCASRVARLREAMAREKVDATIIPISGDMEWLIGHSAIPLERLTALVVRKHDAMLVVPDLEFPGVHQMSDVFETAMWSDGADPYKIIMNMFGKSYNGAIAVGGRMWAQHLLALQCYLHRVNWQTTLNTIPPLRRRKDDAEIRALYAVAEAVDQVILKLQHGDIPFKGRTEREVAEVVDQMMKQVGHEKVDFVLVSYGPNAAIPHHMPDDTVIGENGILLFDIGGTMNGYHSDTTRCVHIGQPSEDVRIAYDLLMQAQEAAVQTVKAGVPAEDVDRAARVVIETDYPGMFIHRTGHGIGMDEHEHPFIGVGNTAPLEIGNTFSVEPGIYRAGYWGMRLEDIVLVTNNGVERLNRTPRELVILNQ